jgi:hypothetical protein
MVVCTESESGGFHILYRSTWPSSKNREIAEISDEGILMWHIILEAMLVFTNIILLGWLLPLSGVRGYIGKRLFDAIVRELLG